MIFRDVVTSAQKKPRLRFNSQSGFLSYLNLTSERIRSDLEFNFLALSAFSAFDVPHEMRSIVGPHCAILPACESRRCVWIVNTGIQSASVEAKRERNAHRDPGSGS